VISEKPEISIPTSPQEQVFTRLHKDHVESKNWAKIEQEKAILELRNCTFSP
jgi:hypothetical protein